MEQRLELQRLEKRKLQYETCRLKTMKDEEVSEVLRRGKGVEISKDLYTMG